MAGRASPSLLRLVISGLLAQCQARCGGVLPLKCQLLTDSGASTAPPELGREGKKRWRGPLPFLGGRSWGAVLVWKVPACGSDGVRREPGVRLPPVCNGVCGPHLVG